MKISINVGAINRMRSGGDMELCVKCAGFGKGKSGKICLKCDGIGVVSALAAQGDGELRKAEAFDQIVAARKRYADAIDAYNARLEFVQAERKRGNWLNVDPEYAASVEAQKHFWRITQELSDAALSGALSTTKPTQGGGPDLVEQMRPHIEKLRGCVAINEAMGRVVEGQADAIRSLTAIFAALAAQGDDAQEGTR